MKKMASGWVLSSALLISGCAEINENMPDVVREHLPELGMLAGGLIGYSSCGGDKRPLCAAGLALAGAWAGSQLVKYLDEQDKQKREAAINTALSEGNSQQWSNSETGNSGSIQVAAANRTENTTRPVSVLKDRVATVPPLDAVGEQYRFTKSANVRGGPGTDYKIVDKKPSASVVDVIGKVKEKPWYFIGEYDVGTGYVHTSLLEPVPLSEQVTVIEPASPFDQSQVATSNVDMSADCVAVTEEITVQGGESETQTTTLCRGPNGWEAV
jgi:hypothetical protein